MTVHVERRPQHDRARFLAFAVHDDTVAVEVYIPMTDPDPPAKALQAGRELIEFERGLRT